MKDDLRPLSLNGNKEEKREIVSVTDDWDDIGINMICELSQITEVTYSKFIFVSMIFPMSVSHVFLFIHLSYYCIPI